MMTKKDFKICLKCKQSISKDKFHRDKSKSDGLLSTCKECRRKIIGSTERHQLHGMTKTRQYDIWRGMKQRCDYKKDIGYKYYGGRGISYCKKWRTFDGFWEDMKQGYKDTLTIDRIDNEKGYTKENCRWSSKSEQSRNKRKTRLELNGCLLSISEWSKKLKITCATIRERIKKGMSPERVLFAGKYNKWRS